MLVLQNIVCFTQEAIAKEQKEREKLEAALKRAERGGEDKQRAKDRAAAMSSFMRDVKAGKADLTLLSEGHAEKLGQVNPEYKELSTQVFILLPSLSYLDFSNSLISYSTKEESSP